MADRTKLTKYFTCMFCKISIQGGYSNLTHHIRSAHGKKQAMLLNVISLVARDAVKLHLAHSAVFAYT